MAGHEGACFSPGGADSLILLPFLSWMRRQMSGKLVHIDFLNCPHPEDGMGDVIHCGAATFNLPCASDPPGKDGGTGSYWESLIQGVWMAQSLHF